MAQDFDLVAAENRQLRKEVKTLRERVAALESSRWWRLHPRYLLERLRPRRDGGDRTAVSAPVAKISRHARILRLKAEFERRSAGRRPDEIVLRDGITLKIHPESRPSFEEFCYASPQEMEELDVFIAATSDRRRLLDVGALHGIFSLVFALADPTKHALAVDPSPAAFAKLLYNIHRNQAQNITAVECALSKASGVIEMHYEWERAVAGHIANGGGRLRVEADTGDHVCEHYSFEPDVVKIDVDGHELRVIQGLRETLRRNRPLLFLEVHPHLIAADPANGTVAELVDELRALGFHSAEFHTGSVVAVEGIGELNEIDRCLLRPKAAS
jgi:FkbM family methyltransferase